MERKEFAMTEWLIISSLAMDISEERISGRRAKIVLEHFNPVRTLRSVARALLTFLF
jgi:hypothetical protein